MGKRGLTSGSGPKGIRTPDLLAASQALYQLSYGPRERLVYGTRMDVSLATFVVFLHVATAFVFAAGLIGRWIVLGRARTAATDLGEIDITPARVADRFEKIVIPGSAARSSCSGLLAMWAQDRPLFDGRRLLAPRVARALPVDHAARSADLPPARSHLRGRSRPMLGSEGGHAGADGGVPTIDGSRSREPTRSWSVGVVVALMVLKPF